MNKNRFSTLVEQTKTWSSRLSLREHIMMAVGIAVIAYLLVDQIYLTSHQQNLQSLQAKVDLNQRTLLNLQNALREIDSGTATDPAEKLAIELEALKRRSSSIDSVLGNVQGTTPQIGTLIRNLIANQHQKIKLQSLKTIASKPLLSTNPGGNPAGAAALLQQQLQQQSQQRPLAMAKSPGQSEVYRHGVELEISGGYFDLLAYLKSLESSSRGLFWSDMKLTVANYPEATLKVTIYILSNQPDPIIS